MTKRAASMNGTHKHWSDARDEYFKEYVAQRNRQLEAKTPNQAKYISAINSSVVTICMGPAGTGKTYIACGIAAQMMKSKKVEKIIITRPIVGCDEKMGDLPGTVLEKVSEDMQPMLDAFYEFFSKVEVEKMIKDEQILIVPFSKMRGRTFKNCFTILDEAQNATFRQLKMFLTRLGENSRMVICGDHTQSDIACNGKNSLMEVVSKFSHRCHRSVALIRLTKADIVRHELIQWIDERLSGYNSYKELDCPACNKRIYYNCSDELLIKCCSCNRTIEILDESDKFSPAIVDEKPEHSSVIRPPG